MLRLEFMHPIRTIFATLPLFALSLPAQEESKETKEPKEFVVKAGPFRHQLAIDGILQPSKAEAISVDPEQWKTLLVKELLPHGSLVKKGDAIVSFDVENLEEKVKDVERSREAARIQLQRAELDLAAAKKTSPLDLDAVRQAAKQAKENLDNWKSIWRPLELEEAARTLQATEQQLDYAKEEMKQLEVMYKADDLTEETEEIILKRGKWAVERAEFALKQAKERFKHTTELTVPRTDKERQDAHDRAAIALEKGEKDNAAVLRLKELEVVEKRHAFEKEEKDFAELKADLEMLRTVKAPSDGRLLWGDWTKDEGPAKLAEFEKKHAASPRACIAPQDVFATVVSGMPDRIAGTLAPDQRRWAEWRGPDAEAKTNGVRHATLEVAPDYTTGVRVLSIDTQPDSQGRFPITLAFDANELGDDDLPAIVPGMKAKVVLSDYRKEDAISIPPAFIETGFADGKRTQSVLVKKEGAAPEKRIVRSGRRSANAVEILDGLKAGEKLAPLP